MYAMSKKMSQSLQGSHRPMIYVGVVSTNGVQTYIPVDDGSVHVDRTSQDVRRTLSFTTGAQNLVPIATTDPLNIYGNHVYVYRGVVWHIGEIDQNLYKAKLPLAKEWRVPANGAYELVPLGVFRINKVSIDESEDSKITISVDASDISSNIGKNHWTNPVTIWKTPYSVPVAKTDTTPEANYSATSTQEAIKILIKDRWPLHNVFGPPTFNFSGVADKNLNKPVIMGSQTVSTSGSNSPWTDITGLATALNAELFVDADGAFNLRTVVDPNTVPPVWSFFDGEGGLLTKATRELSDSKTINYVIATGENTGATTPLRSVQADNDPSSPTYYKGAFGRVVAMEPGRKKLTTQAEVDTAARTYLNWFVGGDESTTIEGVVNPALDVGDVIRIRRQKIGIFDRSSVECQLGADIPSSPTQPLTQLVVKTVLKDIPAGTKLLISNNYGSQALTVDKACKAGSTILYVQPFSPAQNYRKDAIICLGATPVDGGVNYYIDKLEIPLGLDKPISITARERRVGTKKDAVRVAEYSQ
jgi:hypothetical protein